MPQNPQDLFIQNKHFQLERLILFSDAVFAIAITLLVIEIKIPHFDRRVTEHELAEALKDKIPDFMSFIFSFLIIGQFWTNHHRIFGFVKNYTNGLIWLNLLTLFLIVFMPFSTYLNMEFGYLDLTWFWYCLNMALISFSMFLLWRYLGKHPSLSDIASDTLFMHYTYRRTLWITAIFLTAGLLTFAHSDLLKWVSRTFMFFTFPMLSIIRKQYEKKAGIRVSKKKSPA